MKQRSLIFYIQPNCKVDSKNDYDDEYMYLIGEEKAIIGISMNAKYIFFWNLGTAWKMNLLNKEITKLKIYISERETRTFIKKVRTGSDASFVTIIVEQSHTENCIIIFDVENDVERESFDCKNNSIFI